MLSRVCYILLAVFSFVVLLAIWWLIVLSGSIPVFLLPGPEAVVRAGLFLLLERNLGHDIAISLYRIGTGFSLSAFLAIPLGVAMSQSKKISALIEPVIGFIRYIPISALVPLFIVWFGIDEGEKIFIIANSIFFQLVLMVANSVSQVPLKFIESARTLGVTPWQMVTRIILPYSWPKIIDDLRVSMGWAWSALIIAEMVGSSSGLGYSIVQAQRLLQTAQVISIVIVIGLVGIITDYLFKIFTIVLFPWIQQKD